MLWIESVNAGWPGRGSNAVSVNDNPYSHSLDWEDVRFFAALARHHTPAATALSLGSTPDAVLRRLEHLEAALGYALFKRGGSRYRLNAAGAAAMAEAAQMEMAACSLLQKRPALSGHGLSGEVLTHCTGAACPRSLKIPRR
jgi:DNA-binding transcriptional LysR family regulator